MGYVKGKVFQCGLIAVACFVFYGNTIQNDYAFDDSVVVTENQFTQKGIEGIPEIFGSNTFRGSYDNTPTVARYRPLSVATFAIEHQVFGTNPHVSHFINVLLLVLLSLVLHALLSKVFGGEKEQRSLLGFPLVAVLLFIAHPVHTEIVANIKGRDELLALTGAASATLFVLKYLDTRASRYLLGSFVFFLVALLSKESAITFLAIAPLTIYYYKNEKRPGYLRALAPLILASAVFLAAMWLALAGSGSRPPQDIITEPFAYAAPSQRLATIFYTFGVYLRLLAFPHPLTIDYYPFHIQLAHWNSPFVWASLLSYLALTVYALWNLGRRSVVSYGILFYLFSFSVVSNLPFSIGTLMSERFLFAPSLGFVIIVAQLLSTKVFPVVRRERIIVLAISLVCLVKTYSRNEQWRNDFTLFTADASTSSNSIKANLAASVSYLLESQKVDDSELIGVYRTRALEHSKKAVALYERHIDVDRLRGTSYGHALTLLCDCYGANGMLEDTLQCYKKAIRSVSDRDPLYETMETTISKSNDPDFKIRNYLELVALAPDNFLFNYRLGYLYGREKSDLTRSIQYLQKAVELRPKESHALEALAHAYKLSKDYDRAALYLEKAAAENADSTAHLTRLLDIYRLAGNREKEIEVVNRLSRLQQ